MEITTDNMVFYAHEVSINFNPTQFVLDFKSIVPTFDVGGNKPTLFIQHNVVLTEIYHAKMIYELLGKVIQEYEAQFGMIQQPKALNTAAKMVKDFKNKKPAKQEAPSYLG